jgi:small subunit ribosomal protein S4e
MTRGPKKHLKRLNAPKHWMLNKLGGIYAPRPTSGPHKLRECLPLALILRNRLKYALTRHEVIMIVMRRHITVDGKVRTDANYPVGFMDVVNIAKTNENYRLMYNTKGRFVLHAVPAKEAQFKLCRVTRVAHAKKATIGSNPFMKGQASAIPYIVTHDGRTIRYPDPLIHSNDTIKFDISTGKISDHVKFEVGNLAMITRGANIGRVGVIINREKHPGSYEIVHVKDRRGESFATRVENVFVIGTADKPLITFPRSLGIKVSILEKRSGSRKRSGKKSKSKSKSKSKPKSKKAKAQ